MAIFHKLEKKKIDYQNFDLKQIEKNDFFCPDAKAVPNFIDYLTYDDWRRSYSMLVGTWRIDDYYDKIIRGIEIVEKLVERL